MTKLLHSKGIWWFFAALTVFVYLYALNVPLLGPDEPRYAQVAREMFERGDWITPTLGGFHWFEKPALLYWLQIGAYHIFGVSEFAARIGPALFGLGTILSLWTLGRFTRDKEGEPHDEFANWIALLAASSLGLMVFARGASFDIIVTLPLTASLTGFFIFDQWRDEKTRIGSFALCAFYFFAGVSVLAKGLIGIVFPFAIVAVYYLLSRRMPPARFLKSLFWGGLVLAIVAGTWNLPMYMRHGWEFIDEFYIQHHFQRYTSNKYLHPQPFYFFLWVLPLMTFPWLPYFFSGLWRSLKAVMRREMSDPQIRAQTIIEQPGLRNLRPDILLFGLAWIAVPLAFFSLSGSKLPGYILPALPGTVLLTASAAAAFVSKGGNRRGIVFGTAAAMFAVVLGLLTFTVPEYAETDSVKRLIETADARGFAERRVAGFRTVSHNAEFYAAGRLFRDSDGKQIRFDEPAVIAAQIDGPILMLVPLRQLSALVEFDGLRVEPLADNRSLAIVIVRRR